FGTPPMRSSSRMADGTVLIRRTSLAWGSDGNSRAFFARIIFPPQLNVTKISKIDRSKQMEVAASTPENSSGEKTDRAQKIKFTACRCSIATPFGTPVEPEV